MSESRWYDLGNGKLVYRKPPETYPAKSSVFKVPMIRTDTLSEPTQSMADGQIYTSKSALRESYKASGNPHGIDYIEVGNESLGEFKAPERDYTKSIEAIERAEADILAGRAPEIENAGTQDIDVFSVVK